MEWLGGYDLDRYKRDRGLFVLGPHSLNRNYGPWYPPKELTDPMFGPPSRSYNGQRGYGMQLPRFVWEQYEAPPGKRFPPTDLASCYP
jgi:hypothetical protein